jgi:heme/copper-type cytochrome/quinol oxidase subunit 2
VTYFVVITMSFAWLESIQWSLDAYYFSTKDKNQTKLITNIVIQVAFMLNGIIGILMTMFLKFHIKLAMSNKTTIENLEMKGLPY